MSVHIKKYNAIILEKEMKEKGFKDCRIIANNNLKKYWVTVDLYKNKNDAKIAREKYLIDGWIKQNLIKKFVKICFLFY